MLRGIRSLKENQKSEEEEGEKMEVKTTLFIGTTILYHKKAQSLADTENVVFGLFGLESKYFSKN